MGALGLRGRLVAAFTLIVAIASIFPWWGEPVMDTTGSVIVQPLSAWHGTAAWRWAVMLTCAAATVWLLCRMIAGHVPAPVRAGVGSAAAIAVVATLAGALGAPREPAGITHHSLTPSYQPCINSACEPDTGGFRMPDLTLGLPTPAGAGLGLGLALVAMVALTWCLLAPPRPKDV